MIMKRTKHFELLASLFEFKRITDENNNEYVLFNRSCLNPISGISDKTEFEALETRQMKRC